MDATIFKDPLALRFIRCVTHVPGTSINAGGAGWTLQQAIARCESELIERCHEIHELWPSGIHPVGIAAHYNFERALERATQEAIETSCLNQIHKEKCVRCIFHFKIGHTSFGVARTANGFFCLVRGFLGTVPISAYTAARNPLSALFKAWEEFQSIRYFKPQGEYLKHFSKANFLFSEQELSSLAFIRTKNHSYHFETSALTVGRAERSGRVIAYLY